MAIDLMPVSTEAPRCSEFARSIGVLPPGSGLFLDRVILVSVPLPWPKPALKHEMLAPLVSVVNGSAVTSRLFAMEPVSQQIDVEVYERSGATTERHCWQVAQAQDLASLVTSIAGCPRGSLGTGVMANTEVVTSTGSTASTGSTLPPTFLVCTQGSHDSCCGTSGVALADEIAAERSEYVVRRVSHTGGHRFSPTFLAFPEGRMWAFADIELVDRIAADTISSHDVRAHARGWWGSKVGHAQVAECAARAERVGIPFVEPQVEAVAGTPGEPAALYRVTSAGTTWNVQVHVERDIPSIACESPGGLPVKPGREFAWSIERT